MRARRRQRAALEHERGSERRARGGVPAEDVQLSVRADRSRVVDADREIGKPSPRVTRRRVRVDPSRSSAVVRQPAQDDDLAPDDGGAHLGPRQR